MNRLPGEGVGGRQEPWMRKTLRFDARQHLPFKAKHIVARQMRPARAPVPQPSVPEHRHDVRPGEAGDIPNCFTESGTRSFGQEMIEQRNCAANTTKYSVAAVAGKIGRASCRESVCQYV